MNCVFILRQRSSETSDIASYCPLLLEGLFSPLSYSFLAKQNSILRIMETPGLKNLERAFTWHNLRKQRFIRDTVVLLIGATLMQLLGYSVALDIAVVIISMFVAIGSFIVTKYRKDKTDWFVLGVLRGFAWFMDQVASLFIATGVTIWVVLTKLSITGFYAFGSLLFVGLLMEGAISPMKKKAPSAPGELLIKNWKKCCA